MTTFDLSPFPGGDAISAYATRFRRHDVDPLAVGPALDLFPEEPAHGEFKAETNWQDSWPHSERAGVYLVYNQAFQLLYVGKAWIFGPRLYGHFRSKDNGCEVLEKWSSRPRYVINVAVPTNMAFEASALEAFLIYTLKPSDNSHGKHTWD